MEIETVEDLRKYLRKYKYLKDDYSELVSDIGISSPQFSSTSCSSGKTTVQKYNAKIVKRDKIVEEMKQIRNTVEMLYDDDIRYHAFVYGVYIDGKKIREISDRHHYAYGSGRRIMSEAMRRLLNLIKEKK